MRLSRGVVVVVELDPTIGHRSKARRSAVSTSAMRTAGSTPTSGVTNRDGSRDRAWKHRNTVSRGNPDSAAVTRTFTG